MANSLETKKEAVSFIELGTGIITVRHWTDKSDLSSFDVYQLEHSHAVYQKLYNYKSLRALVNFVKANQIKQSTAPCLAPAVPSDDGGGASFLDNNSVVKCDSTNQLADAPQSSAPKQEQPTADACTHPLTFPAKSTQGGVLFLDTETTGLGRHDEIIDIALVDIDENVIYQSFVKPNKPIPKSVTDLNGITNDMVADAPSLKDIYQHINDLCRDKTVVMYDADFCIRMMKQSLSSIDCPNINYFCLMKEYSEHWGKYDGHQQSYKWQKLISACTQQQIQIFDVEANRAVGDAILIKRLYKYRHRWRDKTKGFRYLSNVECPS